MSVIVSTQLQCSLLVVYYCLENPIVTGLQRIEAVVMTAADSFNKSLNNNSLQQQQFML